MPTGTDVLGDQKSVPECSEIRALNFDNVSSLLCHQMSYSKTEMQQIRFRLGLRPRPRWRISQSSPYNTSYLDVRGPTSKGRGDGKGREGREKRGGEGSAVAIIFV